MQWSFTGPAGLLFAGLTESQPQMAPLHNSCRTGTGQRNPKSSILFWVLGVSTRTSVQVSLVWVFRVRVQVYRVGASGIGFSAQPYSREAVASSRPRAELESTTASLRPSRAASEQPLPNGEARPAESRAGSPSTCAWRPVPSCECIGHERGHA